MATFLRAAQYAGILAETRCFWTAVIGFRPCLAIVAVLMASFEVFTSGAAGNWVHVRAHPEAVRATGLTARCPSQDRLPRE